MGLNGRCKVGGNETMEGRKAVLSICTAWWSETRPCRIGPIVLLSYDLEGLPLSAQTLAVAWDIHASRLPIHRLTLILSAGSRPIPAVPTANSLLGSLIPCLPQAFECPDETSSDEPLAPPKGLDMMSLGLGRGFQQLGPINCWLMSAQHSAHPWLTKMPLLLLTSP